MYVVGIDLGTTYTAAAVWRDGRAEIVPLGSRAAAIPSVVLLREDNTVLTGEPANRRGMTEPHRVSREFKRRLGDTTPILLGGSPYSAEALMARLLRWTLDEVATREGGPPAHVCLSHPANWGPYKRDLLSQAVRLADVDQAVSFITEPEAAAVFYAHQQRVEPGSIVAVYDLGGGTFDAAVLKKTEAGFEILGQPEGIERLGGIDFDAAIFHHVNQALDGKLDELDEDDPATLAAVARLRDECVAAKETLSSDTDAVIPVLLPNLTTEVRITRAEFEAMIRPVLHNSIDALRRALRSAGVTPEQLHSVLLVGGSSRIPLVAQLVGAELGRPVAVDAHPKHATSLGAAYQAARAAGVTNTEQTAIAGVAGAAAAGGAVPGVGPAPAAPFGGGAAPTPAVTPQAPYQPATPVGPYQAPTPATPHQPVAPHQPVSQTPHQPVVPPAGPAAAGGAGAAAVGWAAASGGGATPPSDPGRFTGSAAVPGASSAGTPGHFTGPSPLSEPPPFRPGENDGDRFRKSRPLLAGIAAAVIAVLAIGGVVYALSGDDEKSPPGDIVSSGTQEPGAGGTSEPSGGGTAPTQPTTPPPPPPDEDCEPVRSQQMWVCLLDAYIENGELVIVYEAEFAGNVKAVNGGYHLHLYGGDGTTPPAATMGTHHHQPGRWQVEDRDSPLRYPLDHRLVVEVIGDEPKVCARIADPTHALVPTSDGEYSTGNCIPIRRS